MAGFLAWPIIFWLAIRWIDRQWSTPLVWVIITLLGLQLDAFFVASLGVSAILTLLFCGARRWSTQLQSRHLGRWYSEWFLGMAYVTALSSLVFLLPWSTLRLQLALVTLFLIAEQLLVRWQGSAREGRHARSR